MGERILIANIGERDLWYNIGSEQTPAFRNCSSGPLGSKDLAEALGCPAGARHVGRALLSRLEEDRASITRRCAFPIAESLILHLTRELPLDGIVLIATDQPEHVGSERDRDTVFTAQVVRTLVEERFSATGLVRAVECIGYTQHPGPEEAYRFFGRLLSRFRTKEVAELHISPAGGIPSLNAALQQQGLRLFPFAARLHQVVPEKEAQSPSSRVLDVPSSVFVADLITDMIERFIERYDFRGAAAVLAPYADQLHMRPVLVLLQHGAYRAQLAYQKAVATLPPNAQEYSPISLRNAAKRKLARAVEVYYLLQLSHETGEHIGTIWQAGAVLGAPKGVVWLDKGGSKPQWPKELKQLETLFSKGTHAKLNRLRNHLLHDLEARVLDGPEPDWRKALSEAPAACETYLKKWMELAKLTYSLDKNPYHRLVADIRVALAETPVLQERVSPIEARRAEGRP